MNLIDIILSPFIFIIKQLFLFGFSVTNNYGLAILLLSFAISALLLPIFIFIEKAKKKDDAIKLKMKPLIDEIKRCYKGQERYYYLKTVNRQYNYSPTRALIPILSLLIQIPFFIAAYQFLEGFKPLAGVSFMFIKDLNEPDGLLGAINILPIAMTLINLITAYYYTKNGDPKERKQMAIVTGIFLILLFNLPSGLVLYWTMNNVFSFFRLFITNPEVFRKKTKQEKKSILFSKKLKTKISLLIPKLKTFFIIIIIITIASQLNWAFNNSFDNILIRIIGSVVISFFITALSGISILLLKQYKSVILEIKIPPKFYYSLIFIAIYFYLAGVFYFAGVNTTLINIAVFTVITLQFIGVIYIIREFNKTNIILRNITTFILTFLSASQLLNLIAFISSKAVSLSFSNIKIIVENNDLASFVLVGIIFSLITIPYYIKQHTLSTNTTVKSNWLIFFLAVFYLTGLIFLWNPLIVYSSSPESFSFSATSIIQKNAPLFLGTLFVLVLLFWLASKNIKRVILVLIIVISIIAFFNVFILPLDMGTLQMQRFSNINNLNIDISMFIFELFFILGVFWLVNYLIKKQYTSQILLLLIVLNIIPITQSIYLAIVPEQKSNNINYQHSDPENYNSINTFNAKTSISFSKNKENVIVIMTDMFQGWYIKNIMEESPSLKNSFNGFVWYSNTVSTTNYTIGSMPTILAGFDFTPDKLDKDLHKSLGEKNIMANEIFRDKAKAKGFHFTSTKVPYSNMDKKTIDTYLPLWHSDWDYLKNILNIGNAKEFSYSILWQNTLFFSAPSFLKPKIYNNGSWLIWDKDAKKNSKLTKHYNFIRALPYISDTKNPKPNLTLICTKASHFPWDIVDDDGVLHQNLPPYENNKWTLEKIAEWISWMKENEVYNNTKIVIVSDHGIRDTEVNETVMIDNPFIPKISEKIPLKELLYYTPLLMVKDFNSLDTLKVDNRFMNIADVPSIVFNENDQTKIFPANNRTFKAFNIFKIRPKENHFNIRKTYIIKNNVYNINNWEIIK